MRLGTTFTFCSHSAMHKADLIYACNTHAAVHYDLVIIFHHMYVVDRTIFSPLSLKDLD